MSSSSPTPPPIPNPSPSQPDDSATTPSNQGKTPSRSATTTTVDAANAGGFAAALGAWKEINLSELQKTLDAQGIEIVDNQKESLVGRKKLAEETKEFKKQTTPAAPDGTTTSTTPFTFPLFKPLLKHYQTEIDSLTKRSKFAESSFLNLYKLLSEAPDPWPLLDAAVDQSLLATSAKSLESSVERLNGEVEELRKKNEEKERELGKEKRERERLGKLEAKMEEMVQERVSQKQTELNATYDERLRNHEERERDLNRQLSQTRDQLRQLRSSNETTQEKLINHSQRQDQETLGRLAELDLITADLERANGRAAEVERRNEQLRAEIEAVRSGSESQQVINTLRSQLSESQDQTTSLISRLDRQKKEFEIQKNHFNQKEEQKRKIEIDDLEKEVGILREKVKGFGDYDEIKRELEIMKYVEFTGLDLDSPPLNEDNDDFNFETDDGISSTSPPTTNTLRMPDPKATTMQGKGNNKGRTLEGLLMNKNRKLQGDLTRARVAYEETSQSLSNLQKELEDLKSRFEDQRNLNDRLENDLLRINSSRGGGGSGGSTTNTTSITAGTGGGLGSSTTTNAGDPLGGSKGSNQGGRQDPLAGLVAARKTPENSVTAANETSILPIITSQRDRFRQRNSELEEEMRKQYQTISSLRTEIKSLQTDNLKLYEKVRYLQSYRDDASTSGSSSRGLGLGRSGVGGRFGMKGPQEGGDLGKYKNLYEDTINPFEAFRGREQVRAVQQLNPFDKILLGLSRFVLGRRYMRSLFLIYVAALHVFVFFTMYEAAATSDSIRDADHAQVVGPP